VNKTLVILNPAARGDRALGLRRQIEKLCGDIPVRLTRHAGEARTLARQAIGEGVTTLIAAGGDGTINEVVNGIGSSPVQLGILPVGTMNVFALELGIPGNLEAAWEVIRAGRSREVDMPQAGGDYFVQLAGVGLDAEVVRATSREFKKALGPLSYVLSLAQISAQKPPELRVSAEGRGEEVCSFVLVGNGRFYGGPVVLFQKALLDDGLLDVVMFKNQSPWDVVRYLQAILFGSHPKLPDVEYFQTPGLRVESDAEVSVELDGEFSGRVPITFGFGPDKLRVLVR